jgi:hypothetical protein
MSRTADFTELTQLAAVHSSTLISAIDAIGDEVDEHVMAIALATVGRQMLDASVWFRGFRDHLASKERTSPELLDQVLRLVDATQSKAEALHLRFSDLLAAQPGAGGEVSRLAGMVTESVSFLYDSLEMLRWTALECQADVDVDAGRTHGFQSADDAISFLRAQRH